MIKPPFGGFPFKVEKLSRAFKSHDVTGLEKLYELWDEETDIARNRAYLAGASEHSESLKQLMETDRMEFHDRSERGWTPPPKGYARQFDESE